jgi:hypothetical protein
LFIQRFADDQDILDGTIVRIVGVHVRASNIVITSTAILKILLILSINTPPPPPRTSEVKKQKREFWDRLY